MRNVNATMSMIDTGEAFDSLMRSFAALSTGLKEYAANDREAILRALSKTTTFDNPGVADVRFNEFVDLTDFLDELDRELSRSGTAQSLSAGVAAFRSALGEALVHHRELRDYAPDGITPARGLSILFPQDVPGRTGEITRDGSSVWTGYVRNGYRTLKLPAETDWDEFLDAVLTVR